MTVHRKHGDYRNYRTSSNSIISELSTIKCSFAPNFTTYVIEVGDAKHPQI